MFGRDNRYDYSNIEVFGAGQVRIKSVKKLLESPEGQRQINALKRIAVQKDAEKNAKQENE